MVSHISYPMFAQTHVHRTRASRRPDKLGLAYTTMKDESRSILLKPHIAHVEIKHGWSAYSPFLDLQVPYKKLLCYTVHMLSLDFIRQHPEQVRTALRRRCDPQGIDEILRLAEQRRGLATRCDGLYGELEQLREQVRAAPV